MLQNPCKTLGFRKIWSTKFPLGGGGGGKPYPASGLVAGPTMAQLEGLFSSDYL